MPNTDFTFETNFNQIQYNIELWLDNGAGESDQRLLPINPNSVINLIINDTLSNWVTQGSLTFMFAPDGNSGILPIPGYGVSPNLNYTNYVFRNDGLDLLRIRIVPKLNPLNGVGYSSDDEKFWTLSYLFSIYDREEIDMPQGEAGGTSNKVKALKVYFWDAWFQRLNNRIIEFSTATSINKTTDSTLYNGDLGVLKTGQAIKEIIDLGLAQDPDQERYSPGGTELDPSINPAGLELAPQGATKPIGEEFDTGAANIFYTAPTFTTAYDSLMYIYNKHISSAPGNNASALDFCILSKEKGPDAKNIGQLTLKPMSSFFAKAGDNFDSPGDYQIEHFFLQNFTNDETPAHTLRGPISNTAQNTKDISSPGYSYISNYRFVDIAAITNSKDFCNRPVYSYDQRNRTMSIEYQNNSVETARKFIAENYIAKVFTSGSDKEKLFLPSLEDEKKDRVFNPVFSPDGDNSIIRQNLGLQKLLKIGVFENAAINFRTLGLPFRETGRFIAIDKTTGVIGGEFEDKFYGQWFIIDIKHVFETEFYYNDITAIKVHRFTPLPIPLPGTI